MCVCAQAGPQLRERRGTNSSWRRVLEDKKGQAKQPREAWVGSACVRVVAPAGM